MGLRRQLQLAVDRGAVVRVDRRRRRARVRPLVRGRGRRRDRPGGQPSPDAIGTRGGAAPGWRCLSDGIRQTPGRWPYAPGDSRSTAGSRILRLRCTRGARSARADRRSARRVRPGACADSRGRAVRALPVLRTYCPAAHVVAGRRRVAPPREHRQQVRSDAPIASPSPFALVRLRPGPNRERLCPIGASAPLPKRPRLGPHFDGAIVVKDSRIWPNRQPRQSSSRPIRPRSTSSVRWSPWSARSKSWCASAAARPSCARRSRCWRRGRASCSRRSSPT